MPVTLKLTVVEASCVSVSGTTMDVADGSVLLALPESVAGAVLSLLGCCVQPAASSSTNAARCFSFIVGPLSKDPSSTADDFRPQSIEYDRRVHHLSTTNCVEMHKSRQEER